MQPSATTSGLSSRDKTRKIARFNTESCRFPSAGIRHCVVLVAPRIVCKIYWSIEVGTSGDRVLTFGLKLGGQPLKHVYRTQGKKLSLLLRVPLVFFLVF